MRIILFLITFLYSMSVEDYVKGILDYHFKLDKFAYIKAPFFEKKVRIVNSDIKNDKKHKIEPENSVKDNRVKLEKRTTIKLILILSNRAYVKIDEYLGNAIINETKRWVKVGDKIGKCRVLKITNTDIFIKCKREIIHKSLNIKLPLRD